jgi:hypothetical protein
MNKSLVITISITKGLQFNVDTSRNISSRYMKDMRYLGVMQNVDY